jgi:Ca2+-binding EF-hand superfamily protein
LVDTDGSGGIDINELAAALRKEGKHVSDRDIEVFALKFLNMKQMTMLRLDKDHNDKIDFDEFVKGLGHRFLEEGYGNTEAPLNLFNQQEFSSRGQG